MLGQRPHLLTVSIVVSPQRPRGPFLYLHPFVRTELPIHAVDGPKDNTQTVRTSVIRPEMVPRGPVRGIVFPVNLHPVSYARELGRGEHRKYAAM